MSFYWQQGLQNQDTGQPTQQPQQQQGQWDFINLGGAPAPQHQWNPSATGQQQQQNQYYQQQQAQHNGEFESNFRPQHFVSVPVQHHQAAGQQIQQQWAQQPAPTQQYNQVPVSFLFQFFEVSSNSNFKPGVNEKLYRLLNNRWLSILRYFSNPYNNSIFLLINFKDNSKVMSCVKLEVILKLCFKLGLKLRLKLKLKFKFKDNSKVMSLLHRFLLQVISSTTTNNNMCQRRFHRRHNMQLNRRWLFLHHLWHSSTLYLHQKK